MKIKYSSNDSNYHSLRAHILLREKAHSDADGGFRERGRKVGNENTVNPVQQVND